MKRTFTLGLTLFGCLAALAQGNNMDTVKIRPVKVTDNIYMLKGSGGNIGVLIGKDGTLMIDDQLCCPCLTYISQRYTSLKGSWYLVVL